MESNSKNALAGDSGEPYCSNCNYSLVGLTESPRCPECGKPLVEVLQRRGTMMLKGKRYRSKFTIFKLPLWCIAIGPHGSETRGVAKGIVAIGDIAIGFFACGGMAFGVCAIGGSALGLLAFGGIAAGGLALGGGAIGLLAVGGGAIGIVAAGGGVIGHIALGGNAWGHHVITGMVRDPVAVKFFSDWSWFFGSASGGAPQSMMRTTIWMLAGMSGIAILILPVLLIIPGLVRKCR